MPAILVVTTLPDSNRFLPAPLGMNEKVIELPYEGESQYTRIKHNKGQNVSVFRKKYFTEIKKFQQLEKIRLIKERRNLAKS